MRADQPPTSSLRNRQESSGESSDCVRLLPGRNLEVKPLALAAQLDAALTSSFFRVAIQNQQREVTYLLMVDYCQEVRPSFLIRRFRSAPNLNRSKTCDNRMLGRVLFGTLPPAAPRAGNTATSTCVSAKRTTAKPCADSIRNVFIPCRTAVTIQFEGGPYAVPKVSGTPPAGEALARHLDLVSLASLRFKRGPRGDLARGRGPDRAGAPCGRGIAPAQADRGQSPPGPR